MFKKRWYNAFYHILQLILFENLFKPRQLLSATSKQCFEQPAASFLVCSLIFIEYECLPSFLLGFTLEVLQILSLLGILGQGNLVSILFFSEVIDDLEVIGLSLEIHFIDSGDLFSIIAGINGDEV